MIRCTICSKEHVAGLLLGETNKEQEGFVCVDCLKIPKPLRARPFFKGLPIPYTTFIRADDTPDFKIIDKQKWAHAAYMHLCALCGTPLKYWIWFIGGPLCKENRLFADLAMHTECAAYAASVCPYIAYGKEAQKFPSLPEGCAIDPNARPERPDVLYLFLTRNYKLVRVGSSIYAKADAFKEIVEIKTRERSSLEVRP